MAKKSPEERMARIREEIGMIEDRRAIDLTKLQEKKKLLNELETEEVMREVRAYKLSPSEVKALILDHRDGQNHSMTLPEEKVIEFPEAPIE